MSLQVFSSKYNDKGRTIRIHFPLKLKIQLVSLCKVPYVLFTCRQIAAAKRLQEVRELLDLEDDEPIPVELIETSTR